MFSLIANVPEPRLPVIPIRCQATSARQGPNDCVILRQKNTVPSQKVLLVKSWKSLLNPVRKRDSSRECHEIISISGSLERQLFLDNVLWSNLFAGRVSLSTQCCCEALIFFLSTDKKRLKIK